MSLSDTSSAKMSFAVKAGVPDGSEDYYDIPFTSESLSEKLTSAQSQAMRDDRQMAGSRLVRGEASGDIGLEFAQGEWLDELLRAVLQAPAGLPKNPLAAAVDSISNGKTPLKLAFEKKLRDETTDQYTLFQDCEINTLNLELNANTLTTFSIGVKGLDSDPSTTETLGSGVGSVINYNLDDQMDSNSAVVEFLDPASGDAVIPVTAQSLSLSIDNQMRSQQAVGYFNDAGIASGRFKCGLSGTIYFRNQTLYNKFKANAGVKVRITLQDTAGNKYKFIMDNVKTTSYEVSAGGADQDLTIPLEMMAFPDSVNNVTLTAERTMAP